jgi:hypothetical protein
MSNALPMVAALAVLFLGGAAAGDWLARSLAPGSWLAEAVGFFALPVAFALSLQAWYGLALFGILARLATGRLAAVPSRRAPLPGSVVFLIFSSSMGGSTGVLVGILSSTQPLWLVVIAFWTLGTLHGLVGWRLARAGVLMPPDSL